MDVRNESFYFFSIERWSPLLPTSARFVKALKPTSGDLLRECALIELELSASGGDYPPRYVVIVPRHGHSGIFEGRGTVEFVNVFDGNAFIDEDFIDLAASDLKLIDIAGISFDQHESRKWQVGPP
jgi:hypothetical protein